MNCAQASPMRRPFKLTVQFLAGICLAGLLSLPATAYEKEGMPDLCQIEQTCLPTATANLIIWFGRHGYPKLIVSGDTRADGYIHTVRRIMSETDADFEWGTRPDKIASGIKSYIEKAGYECDVEFRGIGKTPFTSDWLKDNDDPNKGFILLLAYTAYNPNNDSFSNAWSGGHAVTLVNSMPDMILVHDPAHMADETGRKILTPRVLTKGTWASRSGNAPVAGLMVLSGSLLEAPPNTGILLIGAVCITMHSDKDLIAISSSNPASASGPNVKAGPGSVDKSAPAPAPAPAAPVSATKSWTQWLFDLLFSK